MDTHHKNLKTDEAAEVGIGTMIVFIATILVAAIAAGVLISTSQNLQAKALQTGNDATENVASTVSVVNVIGKRFDTSTDLQQEDILVTLGSGADPVDLSKMIIQYSDGQTQTDYTCVLAAGVCDAGAGQFTLTWIRGSGTDNVMVAGDLVRITLGEALAASANTVDLAISTSVSINLIPTQGTTVHVGFTSPDSFTDKLVVPLF